MLKSGIWIPINYIQLGFHLNPATHVFFSWASEIQSRPFIINNLINLAKLHGHPRSLGISIAVVTVSID
jgi:hypothetical protein